MKVTVEVSDVGEIEKLFSFFQTISLDSFKIIETKKPMLNIEKGDKSIDPKELFGIRKNMPRTIEEVRLNAWKRP